MKKERVTIIREPEDKLVDTRVSLGRKKSIGIYIVFRGDPTDAVELLQRALYEAKTRLPNEDYTDKRGRPQG